MAMCLRLMERLFYDCISCGNQATGVGQLLTPSTRWTPHAGDERRSAPSVEQLEAKIPKYFDRDYVQHVDGKTIGYDDSSST